MRVQWTAKALADLRRLRDFIAADNPAAASRIYRALAAAPRLRLSEHPRIGRRSDEYGEREVRILVQGTYVLHYELFGSMVTVLRVWHAAKIDEVAQYLTL